MRSTVFSLLAVFASMAAAVAAEPAAVGFDPAVSMAASRNADLRNAQANLQAAEQRARAAYSGFLPQLSGNVSYSDSSTGSGTYSTGVTATQNLFTGFQDEARVTQASASVESARASLQLSKAQLSRDLKVAYAGLSYAQDNVALTEAIQRRLEENLRLVELRFESGRENKGSYLLTRASLAQARLESLQARQALHSAQAQLARVLGRDVEPLRVADAVPLVSPVVVEDFAALVREAPEVRAALAREKSADAEVQLVRGAFYPNVSVSGSATRDGESWVPDEKRNNVSATISIPLYSGGRDLFGTRAAVASLDAARSSRESVEQQLHVRLRQSYATYVESVERLKVDREFLDAAELRASIARARYQNGLVSFEDWDRIEGDLIQRQKAWLASQRDRVSAEAAWELARGTGVIP
jgi:outer membrane protein TolC